MTILLVINGLDFGGTESVVEQLALHLVGRGHRVRVLVVKEPGRGARRLRERGIDVATLGMAGVVSVRSMIMAASRMRRLLGREHFDLVQSFLPRANIVSRVANRFSGAHAPHVSSERSTDFRRSPVVCRLNRYTVRWSDLVLAVSPMVREVLVSRDRIRRDKIVVLENGIDLAAVDAVPAQDLLRAVPGLVSGRLTLCAVGRFVPEKGFLHLVRAFARMRSRAEAQLLLIGEGPEEPAVRREVQALGLENSIQFGGFRPDVLGLLKGADAYVLSSVEEGSPMGLLEAMACALPVVATDVCGVRDLDGPAGPGRAALVVPPADDWGAGIMAQPPGPMRDRDGDPVGQMADAMDQLVRDAALRHALGRAGRRRVEDTFTLDRIVERLEGHYEGLLHGATRRRSA